MAIVNNFTIGVPIPSFVQCKFYDTYYGKSPTKRDNLKKNSFDFDTWCMFILIVVDHSKCSIVLYK